MAKVKAFRLGFADFASQNSEQMIEYYTETMGLKLVEQGKDGSAYLSNGLDHHNIIITPSDINGIRCYGYQLDGKLTMEEVQKELAAQGISAIVKKDAKPGISEFVELKDPSGNLLHLYNQMDQAASGFGISGVVPLKLGHIAFCSNNLKETIRFYEEALGFSSTDQIGEDFANFLTCNSDHHVLNIVASTETKLHHIAFQLKDASHQYLSSDVLAKHGHPVIWGPSRHTAGHNIATYHYDPDHQVIELYTDMDVYIPELGIFEPRPWHKELPLKPKVWDGLSSWGTDFVMDLGKI
ncbi:VOC family protein [Planococcus shenhongbingii]|uniref:VOC family protein n=1 Tax=Planococcus shenhongbingii TaxID=3058398 RepID=A0ABT8NGZ5_9BACL|nr:VOC family protein [Planococcus sp. N017]MDN7247168.1 VOC family protein [Planococcus sp. N017]